MKESNIYFATNTFNYGGEYTGETKNKFDESKGDVAFFRQVMDYDALLKLKGSQKMRGYLTSNYYVAEYRQVKVLDPNFSSVMIGRRKIDLLVQKENEKYDAEYGYPENNDFYPLLGEIVIDNGEMSYADEILGKWTKEKQGIDIISTDAYGLYIKQKAELDFSDATVKPEDAGFEDIEDKDPYYYIYEDAAVKENKLSVNLDKAKLYEQKYGSIFRAFSDVTQEEIIEAPVEQWSFVNAGPGTGKTYTLMKKITYMIETLEADPEGILVLCFTNAAVNEIKTRIKRYAEEEGNRTFINVDVRTFHSFSWLLISEANELFCERQNYHYIELSQLNYDQSIRTATEIIKKYGDEVFGGCEHLIIDEIQDLTDERAYLVITMVHECMKNNVGLTILGDSCQAIYDYSEEETLFELRSERFYKIMFSEFYEKGKFYKLEKNHRQSEWLIRETLPLRQSILNGKKNDVRKEIMELSYSLPELISGCASVSFPEEKFLQMTDSGTVCLMCRNNAQVLATSTNLRKRGISHVVNAYDEFEYLADWIGKIFGLFTKEIITFNEFKGLAEMRHSEISPEIVWERLQELIGSGNNVLKIYDILRSVANSKVDDPIFRNVPKENLIVSNIHKAKGREYDTVVLERKFVEKLLKDMPENRKKYDYLEEAKTLYVAVTRPRMNLFLNDLSSPNVSLKRVKTGRKRWARGDGKNLVKIEVRACTDADADSYNTTDNQEYIINRVIEGDEIKLLLDTNAETVTYNVVHISEYGERVIGRTSMDFIEDIDAIITPYESPWPRRITDLFVSGIHSKISDDYKMVWCWVDFCGLGSAQTDIY